MIQQAADEGADSILLNDSERILALASRLAGCADFETLGGSVLPELQQAFDASASIFYLFDSAPAKRPRLARHSGLSDSIIASHFQLSDQDPGRADQMLCWSSRRHRVITPRRFSEGVDPRTRYYRDIVRPLACNPLGVIMMVGESMQAVFGVFRPLDEPDFDEADVKRIENLVPFLQCALARSAERIAASDKDWLISRLVTDLPYDGLAVLDASLRILHHETKDLELQHFWASSPVARGRYAEPHAKVARVCETLLEGRAGETLSFRLPLPDAQGATRLVPALARLAVAGGEQRILLSFGDRTTPDHVLPLAALTRRERETVQLAQKGLTNREIAAKLSVSASTIGKHLASAYGKLDVSGRVQLAVPALGVASAAAERMGRRELQVAEGLCRGEGTRAIALRMGIAEASVYNHVRSLHRKFGTRTRAALVSALAA